MVKEFTIASNKQKTYSQEEEHILKLKMKIKFHQERIKEAVAEIEALKK